MNRSSGTAHQQINRMIEVFKTNIKNRDQAKKLIVEIDKTFSGYEATADLEDCDRILRVKSIGGSVQSLALIALMKGLGIHSELLPDDLLPARHYGDLYASVEQVLPAIRIFI
jgi:hypothetical protein